MGVELWSATSYKRAPRGGPGRRALEPPPPDRRAPHPAGHRAPGRRRRARSWPSPTSCGPCPTRSPGGSPAARGLARHRRLRPRPTPARRCAASSRPTPPTSWWRCSSAWPPTARSSASVVAEAIAPLRHRRRAPALDPLTRPGGSFRRPWPSRPSRSPATPDADQLLVDDPLALLLGMLLDQQVPMEWAFRGPAHAEGTPRRTPRRRRHRRHGPRRRGRGVLPQAGPAPLPRQHGQAGPGPLPAPRRPLRRRRRPRCGKGPRDAADLSACGERPARLRRGEGQDLHGHAGQAVRQGPRRAGEEVAGPFGDDQPRSVADVGSDAELLDVRAWKKAKKAAGKAKTD